MPTLSGVGFRQSLRFRLFADFFARSYFFSWKANKKQPFRKRFVSKLLLAFSTVLVKFFCRNIHKKKYMNVFQFYCTVKHFQHEH